MYQCRLCRPYLAEEPPIMHFYSASIRLSNAEPTTFQDMEADAQDRMDAKLDRILGVIEDLSLGSDGIELIEELLRISKTKKADEPA